MTRPRRTTVALVLALACATLACSDDVRAPIDARRLGLGAAPAPRPVLRGASAFVLFEDAWSDGSWLYLEALTWPEHALPPRSVDVLADCTATADGSLSIESNVRRPGTPVSASLRWADLCPRDRLPERTPLALQLLDVCVNDACETLAGTIEVVRNGEPWP